MNTKQLIGNRIRRAREEIGITQEELAARVGKSQDSISLYENGTRGVQSSDLPAFAEALNVHVNYFYGDVYPEGELVAVYDQLPEKARDLLIEYAHMLERQFN